MKLYEWELGYVLAILDSIKTKKSVSKEWLSERFLSHSIAWLVNKDLLRSRLVSIDDFEEIRTALTKRSRSWIDESVEKKLKILKSIDDEAE